jgi:hypothetical protein
MGGVEVQVSSFLTLTLVEDDWSASLLVRFTPWELAPGTLWIGGSVGHSRSGRCKEKPLAPVGTRIQIPRSSSRNLNIIYVGHSDF